MSISPLRPGVSPLLPVDPSVENSTNFGNFQPTSSSALRDGGTVVLEGNLNRSEQARIRFDGGLNSPTRGKFFVETKIWNKPWSGSEQEVSPEQVEQLKTALAPHAGDPSYTLMLKRIESAQRMVPQATPAVVDQFE